MFSLRFPFSASLKLVGPSKKYLPCVVSVDTYVSHSELFAFFKVGKTYLRTMKTSDGGYAIELKEALAGGSSVTIEVDSVMDGLLKYGH